MTLPQLRPYQHKGTSEIRAAWMMGFKNVLRVLPTGGGKSVEISHDVLHDNLRGIPDITIAHRKELVTQMSMHVARAGVYHRIIGPANVIAEATAEHRREFGRSFINPTARSAVGGIDTLMSRKDALGSWGRMFSQSQSAGDFVRFNVSQCADERVFAVLARALNQATAGR